MNVRVYRSLAAHDRDDPQFWAALSVEERLLQVWRLSEEQRRLRNEFPDESGFQPPGDRVPNGPAPVRIDVLTQLSGLTFTEAWATRTRANFGPIDAEVIGRDAFIKNKRATGRAKDLGDIEALGD